MQLKLDELIRATHTARNRLVNMEAMSDEELAALHEEFKELHRRAGEALEERRQHDRRLTPSGNPVGLRIGDATDSTQRGEAAAAAGGKANGQG